MSFAISSAAELVLLAIMVGILKALKTDDSVENNTKAFSVLVAFSGGIWRKYFTDFKLAGLDKVLLHSPMCTSMVLL